MAYCVYFDFPLDIRSAERIWKFKTPTDVEWHVKERWANIGPGMFPRTSLSPYMPQPQRFAHEIFMLKGDLKRYYAKLIINIADGWHPFAQIVRTLDLAQRSVTEILFEEYKMRFVPPRYHHPVVLRCTIELFPLFHIYEPECIPLSPDIDNAPTLEANEGFSISLSEDMMNLMHSGYYSDVVVECGSVKRKVHKNILATRSQVLATMILAKQDPLKFLKMEEDVLDQMLTFIYTGTAKLRNASLARRLHTMALKYEMTDLMDVCSSYLQELASRQDNPQ